MDSSVSKISSKQDVPLSPLGMVEDEEVVMVEKEEQDVQKNFL